MSVATDLNAAAQYLRDHGWQQGTYGKPGGPTCMEGALQWGAGVNVWVYPIKRDHPTLVFLRQKHPPTDIFWYRWNDDPVRTKEEVIAKLEELADLAEAEGL